MSPHFQAKKQFPRNILSKNAFKVLSLVLQVCAMNILKTLVANTTKGRCSVQIFRIILHFKIGQYYTQPVAYSLPLTNLSWVRWWKIEMNTASSLLCAWCWSVCSGGEMLVVSC